ncbi:hypothetical protein ElyMa_004367300 [Elysia marginata]|uniref:Uncharacterized protein n=1 Tax=Elysia marginata TaxID=1093978 RepID=A0AAV4H470_9GAST|nr:hypothetical protein ElyMa_004367300 [Elysia marginata]
MAKEIVRRRLYLLFYVCSFCIGLACGITCASSVTDADDASDVSSKHLILACVLSGLLFLIDRLAACFPQTSKPLFIGITLLRAFTISLTVVPLVSSLDRAGLFFTSGCFSALFQALTVVASIFIFLDTQDVKKDCGEAREEERRRHLYMISNLGSSAGSPPERLSVPGTGGEGIELGRVEAAAWNNNGTFLLPISSGPLSGVPLQTVIPAYSEIPPITYESHTNSPPGYSELEDSSTTMDGNQRNSPPGYSELSSTADGNQRNTPPGYSELSSTADGNQTNTPPGYSELSSTADGNQTNSPPGYSEVSSTMDGSQTNPPPKYSDVSAALDNSQDNPLPDSEVSATTSSDQRNPPPRYSEISATTNDNQMKPSLEYSDVSNTTGES